MRRLLTAVLAVATVFAWMAGAAWAQDDDLQDLLRQVGEEYAVAYAAPLIHGFGPNQNANLFHTAAIPRTGLTFGVGVKVMGTYLAAEDQTFRKVIPDVDLGDYDPTLSGQTGTIVMSGPTLFGDEDTEGQIVGYYQGVEVYRERTITGLVDTRWVPLATPEVYLGGIAGVKAVVRYMPSVGTDIGDAQYWGLGLQWNVNTVVPTLPVDVLVGYMGQKFEVGDIVDADAASLHLAVSKSLPALTVYGGLARESSTMDVSYLYEDTGTRVEFSADGRQETRLTLGATLDILMKLNVEMGYGDLTTYSAGLMFGM